MGKSNRKPSPLLLGLAVGLVLLAAGCLEKRQPAPVKNYVLEYPAPAAAKKTLPQTIKVRRFNAAREADGTGMAFKPGPFQRDAYLYHRWISAPADMISDLLFRDLAASRAFAAVFGPDDTARARFELQGGLLECLQVRENGQWLARLKLTATLLDNQSKRLPGRVAWQRDYKATKPLAENSPEGLARAMSLALQDLSATLRQDLAARASLAK